MPDLAIEAVGLSKQYRIGQMHSAVDTLRDHVMHGLRTLRTGRPPRETIWALDDVSFQVHEGEVLGIIGRNGAGKTTLLRLLSRITEPTKGYADVTGRDIRLADPLLTCSALGSAMHGAVAAGRAAGGYDSIFEAAEHMARVEKRAYRPRPENREVYNRSFAEYRTLHDYFGRGANDVMKRLKALQRKQVSE